MAFSFAQFGNDLYAGKRSYDFVGRWRTWFAVAAVLVLASILLLAVKQLNPGIEFRGGSELRVSGVSTTDLSPAEDVVADVLPAGEEPRISVIGADTIRVQTQQLDEEETDALRGDLAEAYDVAPNAVTSSFVGASWGDDVTRQALLGLFIFIALASLVMAIYFRAWQAALAIMVALVHDLVLTAGIYALIGFEVTPAAVIGFLTILGYSLYDTVVVFDKIRENTAHVLSSTRRTYAEAANLAVNQTLVRSINTTIVALLPVSAILFIGAFLLGAGTLKDISLALFVGMFVGAYSSIFIAPAVLVLLRRRDPAVRDQEARVARARQSAERAAAGEADPTPAAPRRRGSRPAAAGGRRTGSSVSTRTGTATGVATLAGAGSVGTHERPAGAGVDAAPAGTDPADGDHDAHDGAHDGARDSEDATDDAPAGRGRRPTAEGPGSPGAARTGATAVGATGPRNQPKRGSRNRPSGKRR
jgi:preprotein translocase subunit SecF